MGMMFMMLDPSDSGQRLVTHNRERRTRRVLAVRLNLTQTSPCRCMVYE